MAIASFLLLLEDFLQYNNIELKSPIHVYIDNSGAMELLNGIKQDITQRKYPDNADAMAIIGSCKNSLKKLHFIHVTSHQDKKIKPWNLSRAAQINTLADKVVTQFLKQATHGEWAPISIH